LTDFPIEVCKRLPLAEAAFRILDFALDREALGAVFERHRGGSLERRITFPDLVHLICDCLLGHRAGSAHQTFRRAADAGELGASVQAVYGKLRRLPLGLSLGLFDAAAARMRRLNPAPAPPKTADSEPRRESAARRPLPASLAPYRPLGFDGKKLKYVARKLKPLRGLRGNIFGGKVLVVQDLTTRQAVALEAVADGEAADNPLAPGAVARVRADAEDPRPRLWVGDRAFSEFKSLGLLSAGDDRFVIRHNAACQFRPDPAQPARTGVDAAGRPYRDEWGRLGTGGRDVRARKITVPRGDGAKDFALLTTLDDADRYPASDLLELYRHRWGLETMFEQLVQTFDLRHLIGATPQATVFQAALCLLLYNATLVIRDAVASGADVEPNEVSSELLFGDVTRQLTGWLTMIPVEDTLALLRAKPVVGPEALRKYLRGLLAPTWTDLWRKAPYRTQPPRPAPKGYLKGGHSSVDKILRGVHDVLPLAKTKRTAKAQGPPGDTQPPNV
jgi:hypothetical protein